MLELLLLILGIASMSVLFVVAEPLIISKHMVFKMIWGKKDYTNSFIWKLINCCLCSGFYIGLIFTQDIYQASIISILSELIYKKINEFKWQKTKNNMKRVQILKIFLKNVLMINARWSMDYRQLERFVWQKTKKAWSRVA